MADDQQQLPTGGDESSDRTVRWENAMHGWTAIPNSVLLDGDLSVNAKVTYAGLAFYARQDEKCWPGQKRFAAQAGVPERSMRRAVRELEEAGLIETTRRGHRTNVYTLLSTAPWAGRKDDDRPDLPDQSAGEAGNDRPESPTEVEAVEEEQKKKQADPLDEEVEKVWAEYVKVFEPGERVKLGPNRIKGMKRALAEVDCPTLCQAVRGLYEFRRTKPGDETIETIWKTYKGTGTMVERINFFASKGKAAAPGGKTFPSASKAIIQQRQTDVQRGHGSVVPNTVNKARESEEWLLAHGIETVRREGDGYPVFRPVRSDAV